MSSPPAIRCFPSADRAFARDVAELVAQLRDGPPTSPKSLEEALRRRYPEALVRSQDPFATLGGQPTWYVYRRPPIRTAEDASAPAGEITDAPRDTPLAVPGFADIPIYAPPVVARMIGIPLAVLVGWDVREGLVKPTTADGVRLYSRRQVEQLRRLRTEIMAGRETSELQALRDAPAGAAPPVEPAAADTLRKVVVLVAERDPFAAEFVEYLLTTEGYGVTIAYGAAEAEAVLAGERPEVAIVETLLPDGRGLELCARLAAADVPVIAIAAVDGESRALDAGASAFLPKPLQPLRLLSAVRDLLGDSAFARGAR